MVQRSGAASVEVNKSNNNNSNNTYIYYLMNSTNGHSKNELTDADSIDSGTCSDNSQKTSPIPPAVKMSTKIVLNGANGHRHEPVIYSDSDESESSLSSMGSNTTNTTSCSTERKVNFSLSFLPDSLLKDIRDHSINTLNRKSTTTTGNNQKKKPLAPLAESVKTSKITIQLKDSSISIKDGGKYPTSSNAVSDLIRPNTYYESDKFYNFHIHERDTCEPPEIPLNGLKSPDLDESFAGYKEAQSGSSTIRSAKGTVRGVKNRVRNGIATFLQIQQHTVKVSTAAAAALFST